MITYSRELFTNTGIWWFQSVFVVEAHRKKGVFTKMFKQVEDLAKEGHHTLRLYVEKCNFKAQATYQKLGMYDTGQVIMDDDFYFRKEEHHPMTGMKDLKIDQLKSVKQFEELFK